MNNQGLQELPFVVVVVAILQLEGKILLTRRKLDAHQGGLWEFPGGKQEVGETLKQCLRRELREELDITVGVLQPFDVLRHCYPDKEVELHFFTCSQYHGDPKPLGGIDMVWVPKGELSSYEFLEADRPIVEKLIGRSSGKESCS